MAYGEAFAGFPGFFPATLRAMARPLYAAIPSAPQPGAAADPKAAERLKAVREFFLLLRKGVKNIGMYRHDPKRFPGFLQPASAALEKLLQDGPLPFDVEAEAFLFLKEPVWAIEAGENIPGRFFREGVRQIALRPGMTAHELETLVGIMLTNPDRGGEEILSQLFNASFEHVSYSVAELFAFGDLSEAGVKRAVEKVLEELERRHATATPDVAARAQAITKGLDAKLESMERREMPYVREGQVRPSFRSRVQDELKRDDEERLHRHLVSFALGQLKDGSFHDAAQAADVLAQLADGLLARADLAPLARLFALLDESDDPHLPAREIKNLLGARLSEEPRLRQLGTALNASTVDWMAAARYLAECSAGAAPVLLDLLAILDKHPARLLVLEAVAGIDKEAGHLLSERLDVDGPRGVADLIALADRLPPVERGKLVERAIRHPSATLRVEAVKGLSRSTVPEAMHRFALEATTDASPAVRAEAFRCLVKLSPRRAVQDLMRLPKLPDWDKRPSAEKELVFECLGRTETDEAFLYAMSLLQQPKKGLLKGKRVEMKLFAIRVLQAMPTLQAFKALSGVGTLPDQDSEATAAAHQAAPKVRAAMLAAEKGAAADPAATEMPGDAGRAIDFLRKTFAARRAAQAASPPPATDAAPTTPESYEALDDLFGASPTAPRPPAPTWASPAPGPVDPRNLKGGGR